MLTPAQTATFKADVLADSTFSNVPHTSDGAFVIEAAYNAPSATNFLVWRTDVPVSNIYDSIDWTKYTPADTPDATVTFTNRALVIQTKQMNLQNILQGRATIDASKANTRAGLRDAVIALPAGASGASIAAGGASGVATLTACTRIATRLEQLLVTSSPTTGKVTAGVMGFEGQISYSDVQTAMGW